MLANVTPCSIGAFFCILVAWVLVIVSMVGNHWMTQGKSSHSGLFRTCTCDLELCVCKSFDTDLPDWLKAVIAAVSLALIGTFLAVVTQFFYLIRLGNKAHVRILTIALVTFAMLWNILAVYLYGVKYHELKTSVRTAERALGWTFWQPITSIGLQLLAIGLVTATKFPDA